MNGVVLAAVIWAVAVVPLGYLVGRWLRRATRTPEPETPAAPGAAAPSPGDLSGTGPDDGRTDLESPDRSRA
jgi:hypothetical protein